VPSVPTPPSNDESKESTVKKRTASSRSLLGLALVLLAIAIPAVGVSMAGQEAVPEQAPSPAIGAEAQAFERIVGTDVQVPVPDREIGSRVEHLAIGLQDSRETVRGVAFYRPGPIEGSVVGGVSVVYDDASPMVTSAIEAGTASTLDARAIAREVEPRIEPETTEVGGRTVLGWPASEVVPADLIPQDERSVSRYVVLLDGAIAMVTFDDVPAEQADAYLATVAGAL
jgi:hypothetical protein